jgi:cell fate regulator YaaT (PSP1 superfamily)
MAQNTFSSRQHFVRLGALGSVGLFTSVDAVRYPRGSRVVVRTGRGLEIGEVLAEPDEGPQGESDGSILRGVTVEDELLLARLERNRAEAYQACALRISELQLPVALMDVEQLFDARTLVFYFLGDMTPEVDAITAELAELYESCAQIQKFADAVNDGCGPGCGTDSAAGCKTCVTGCAIASACAQKH